VEKFKQKRNLRQKYVAAALLFFFLLTAGIISVDYSTNYLLTGNQCMAFAAVNSKASSLEIVFMNRKIYINTQYIKRDMKKLKNDLQRVLGI
jgi:hypothetical protein